MGTNHPSLLPEIGPDGIAREASVIAYTEKIIEEEQLQLKRYIKENYSKIREVERELENLTLDMKLTAGPKKAALEHLRKKIELSNERIHAARLKEDQTRKVWEAAAMAVKDEEAIKQKLCDDLSHLVQEGATAQFSRLEELKRRLEAMNPTRASIDVPDGKLLQPTQSSAAVPNSATHHATDTPARDVPENGRNHSNIGNASNVNSDNQRPPADGEGKGKKRALNLGRGKGNTIIPKGRGGGWTGAGFDVDGRT